MTGETKTEKAGTEDAANKDEVQGNATVRLPHYVRNSVIGVVCAVAFAAAIAGLFVWQPWPDFEGDATGVAAMTNDTSTSAPPSTDGENVSGDEQQKSGNVQPAADNDSVVEEWNNKEEGYVGPGGEGMIRREDFDSEEAYQEAVIEAGAKEYDAPEEEVFVDDEETHGYYKGKLILNFYRTCGEKRAREVVSEFGGIWVSSDFAWDTGLETASVETYFENASDKKNLRSLSRQLSALPEVESAYMDSFFVNDQEVESQSLTGMSVNDLGSYLQYHLHSSYFHQAWEIIRCLGAVEVAVFDTGIYSTHEDLAGNVSHKYDAYHKTSLTGTNQDTSGHGTQVAGIISAVTNNTLGVAGASYNAKVVPVRVTSQVDTIDWFAVEEAFEYVLSLSNKPEVINMSFGGRASTFQDSAQKECLQQYVHKVRDEDGIVCVAAGGNNDGTKPFYPAKFDGVLGVSALNQDGTWADYSNYNSTIDLCAPGTNIISTVNPDYTGGYLYGCGSGTSFAAPQVAAAAALVKQLHSGWSAEQVENRLITTAQAKSDGDSIENKLQYGNGSLHAGFAVGWSSSSGSGGSSGGSAPYGNISNSVVVNTRFLTTYGVRDGSAGPDFLGISNTNIDLLAGGADLYSPADATETSTKQKVPLALWGGTVNQNPNPYYTNLLYHAITGTQSGQYEATTWRANSSDGSWGDSDGTLSYTPSGQSTIAGLEYAPDLIFGANKYVNWNLKKNGSNSGSLIYEEISKKSKYEGYDPVFVNYDTTNLWTQLYSMNQLAKAADGLTR